MYILKLGSSFKTHIKKFRSNKKFKQEVFDYVTDKLIAGEKLEEKFRDHELKGDLQGERECHIAPDILLKYKYQKDILILLYIDIGSHSDLF